MSAPHRNPALDGVRGLAILLVLLHHLPSGRWVPGGRLGVDLFLVLSGYLITSLLASGRASLRRFYAGRARRLLPGLAALFAVWLPMAVLAGRSGWFTAEPHAVATGPLGPEAALQSVLSVLTLQTDVVLAAGGTTSGLDHLWSLVLEEQFYLVWPVTLALFLRVAGRRGAGVLVLLITLAGASWNGALLVTGAPPARIYFSPETRVQALTLGAVLALLPETVSGLTPRAARLLGTSGAAVLLALAVTVDDRRLGVAAVLTVAALAGAALVAYAVRLPGDAPLGWPWLRWLGRRSYGIYLWHYLFATWLSPIGWWGLPLGAAAGLIAAQLSWQLIEQRFLRPGEPSPPCPDGSGRYATGSPGRNSTRESPVITGPTSVRGGT